MKPPPKRPSRLPDILGNLVLLILTLCICAFLLSITAGSLWLLLTWISEQ